MKKQILINQINKVGGFLKVETDYSWELYEKRIELHTVMEEFFIFGAHYITAYVRIDGDEVHISGNYGKDGSQTFYNGRMGGLTRGKWFDCMVQLHNRY